MKTILPFCLLLSALVLAVTHCSDGDHCAVEGASETDGPGCCSDGCGNSAVAALPRTCQGGRWSCGKGVLQANCASPEDSCKAREACTGIGNGLGDSERDPAPDLCCEQGCDGSVVLRRICKTGIKYECPPGSVPISTCPNPLSACGGAIPSYRQNGFTLP